MLMPRRLYLIFRGNLFGEGIVGETKYIGLGGLIFASISKMVLKSNILDF